MGKKEKDASSRFVIKVLVSVLIAIGALGIFYLGVNVGNGKITFLRSNQTGLPSQLDYSTVNDVYQALKNNYYEPLNEEQVLNGIKHGIAESTNDPYTSYFTPAEAQNFNSEINKTIYGIGADLGKNSNGDIQVIAPIAGSPAAKAGIQPKDIITSVNGQSTTGMSIDDAVSKIRGKAGTKVDLVIIRNNQTVNVSIIREKINVPSVTSKTLDGNIGYIQISTFADDTYDLTNQAAQKFKSSNVKGIVLDLRNDPGGLLDAAIKVSSLWLPGNDQVLSERRGNVKLKEYNSNGDNTLAGIPTVVLINSGSASASEITTAALKDNKAAFVIGEKSYGKGVVQQLINLAGGAQLKVTIANWYRPNGQNINKKGITPDQTVTLSQDQYNSGNDTQLNAALNYLNK